MSASSPSDIPSRAETLKVLRLMGNYEPILMLAAVAIYMQTGSFMVSDIFKLQQPLLFSWLDLRSRSSRSRSTGGTP